MIESSESLGVGGSDCSTGSWSEDGWRMVGHEPLAMRNHYIYIYMHPYRIHGNGIFTYIWLMFMVNVWKKYTIHCTDPMGIHIIDGPKSTSKEYQYKRRTQITSKYVTALYSFKFNIAPKNCHPKRKAVLQPSFFRSYV